MFCVTLCTHLCARVHASLFFLHVWTDVFVQVFHEAWHSSLFNVIFTSIPVLVYAIFDRDFLQEDTILKRAPELYEEGQKNSSVRSF